MKILVVDDEKLIREVIIEYLKRENYEYMEAENGLEAVKIAKNNDIDMIIMDIMMPKMDGFEASCEIRKDSNVPILMLSARDTEIDKLNGFNLGIDDYITKPFSPKELIARIKAIAKRSSLEQEIFEYEDLKVDYKAHSVFVNNKEIKLTPKEYELLTYFIKNKNIALSRETLLSKLWGYDYFGDYRTIDTHIKMLRNNLGKYRDLITTVRAVGYKFEIK
jgi:DNA-binding response OmpR family regulator